MSDETQNKDWPFEAWLKVACIQLGLSPQDFWAMSLADWFALTRSQTPTRLTQTDLDKMEQDYEF